VKQLGDYVEGFGRFSRLLDGGLDAFHGSLASVLRVFEFSAELFYVIQSFAVFRFFYKIWKVLNWLVGRNVQSLTAPQQNTLQNGINFEEFQENSKRTKRSLVMSFLLLGITCVSAPAIISKVWKILRERRLVTNLERVWNEADSSLNSSSTFMARALYDFRGEDPRMDLNFRQDDLIKVISKPFPEWWEGEINGRTGLFPSNLVEPVISEVLKK